MHEEKSKILVNASAMAVIREISHACGVVV